MSKILIVEDDALNLKLFCDLLSYKKHQILISRDGIGVYAMVLEHMPNLILMDIQLKGVSGLDLIQELKRNKITSNIPIIAITAFAMANDEAKITASGCDLYLSKPVFIDEFYEAISQLLNNNTTLNLPN